jgi:ribonuclease R
MKKINIQSILQLLEERDGISLQQFCKLLSAKGQRKEELKNILKKLVKDKLIERGRHKKYYLVLPDNTQNIVEGRLDVHERGFGFVTPLEPGQDDVYVPKRAIGKANHMDLVRVQVIEKGYGDKQEGRILEIIDESDRIWMGVVYPLDQHWYFCPWGRRHHYAIDDHDQLLEKAQEDDIFLATLEKDNRFHEGKSAKLSKRLGSIDNPRVDTDILIHEYELDTKFSRRANREAFTQPVEDPCKSIREDLSHLPFVTIDGEDAKDFDDAVYMDEQNHLWVAIADVSHFVEANGELDQEACARGNSFYFCDRVVPMLPEVLSNDWCSLRPLEKKMAMVVKMAFDENGFPNLLKVTPAVIESKARLTYNQVHSMLQGDVTMDDVYKDSLTRLSKTTQHLYQMRLDQGGLDFDLPDVRWFPQETGLDKPVLVERNQAHHLIEECMLATNRCVSKFVDDQERSNIYRIHPRPDSEKLKDTTQALLDMLGPDYIPDDIETVEDIQKVLARVEDLPQYAMVQYLFLRSMAQAQYAVTPQGHFGLGFEHYSHFTSPIRRYADLILHRMVKQILLKQPENKWLFPKAYDTLENVCLHISAQDRTGLLIERAQKKIKGIRWIQAYHTDELIGFVTGIMSKGVFVETNPHGIEGLVSAQSLKAKGFQYDEANNQFVHHPYTLSYGSHVKVGFRSANLFKRQIDFDWIDWVQPPEK